MYTHITQHFQYDFTASKDFPSSAPLELLEAWYIDITDSNSDIFKNWGIDIVSKTNVTFHKC